MSSKYSQWQKWSPLIYLFAYAALIFGFGLAYQWRAADFYHPYVRYERTMVEEARAIRENLTQVLRRSAKPRATMTPNFHLRTEELNVKSMTPVGGTLMLLIDVVIDRNKGREDDGPTYFTVSARMGEEPGIEFDPTQNPDKIFRNYINFQDAGLERDSFLNDGEMTHWKLQNALSETTMTSDENLRIQNFLEAYAGFPRNIPNSYWRMVYLSAMTITTVGYGDIVPMTGLARLLTATEATCGIVLLGLFVNSLWASREARKHA